MKAVRRVLNLGKDSKTSEEEKVERFKKYDMKKLEKILVEIIEEEPVDTEEKYNLETLLLLIKDFKKEKKLTGGTINNFYSLIEGFKKNNKQKINEELKKQEAKIADNAAEEKRLKEFKKEKRAAEEQKVRTKKKPPVPRPSSSKQSTTAAAAASASASKSASASGPKPPPRTKKKKPQALKRLCVLTPLNPQQH